MSANERGGGAVVVEAKFEDVTERVRVVDTQDSLPTT
jgi:hypothetical protein